MEKKPAEKKPAEQKPAEEKVGVDPEAPYGLGSWLRLQRRSRRRRRPATATEELDAEDPTRIWRLCTASVVDGGVALVKASLGWRRRMASTGSKGE